MRASPTPEERIEMVEWPLDELDGAIERVRGRQVADRAADCCKRRCCCRQVAAAGRGPPGKYSAWRRSRPKPPRRGRRDALRGARPRLPRPPRVRARAVAQHARRLPHRPAPVRPLPGRARSRRDRRPSRGDLSDFLADLAQGDGNGRAPCSTATVNRKAACLRSFYRHLRREERDRRRPDRAARRRRAGQEASRGPELRARCSGCWRSRAATTRPRCATGRCWS